MCKKLIFLISLLLVPVLVAEAQIHWTDADPCDHLWSTPNNWDGNSVPTWTDEAHIGAEDHTDHNLHGPIIDSTMDLKCDRLKTGFLDPNLDAGQPKPTYPAGAVLYITGGNLEVTNWWGNAEWTNTVATLKMSGGHVLVLRGISIGSRGWGDFYMTGGLMEIVGTRDIDGLFCTTRLEETPSPHGHTQIDCGTIDATRLIIRHPTGSLDITEGTLILHFGPDEQMSDSGSLNDYIDSNQVTAYGDAPGAKLLVSYDADADETTVWGWTPPNVTATNPEPRCGTFNVVPTPTLCWTAGTGASGPAAHEIYLGTDWDDVNDANTSSAEYEGAQDIDANCYSAGMLQLGQTYYWRIDQVDSAGGGQRWKGRVWSFTVTEGKATDPRPEHGAWDVPVTTNLIWSPGPLATHHDVYFGTDFNDVNDATDPNVPPGQGQHDVNTYDPLGNLNNFTRYYWRIDEVGGGTTIKGDVWSFITTVGGTTVLRCDVSNTQVNVKEGWTIITKDNWTQDEPAITRPDVNGTGIDITLDTGSAQDLSGNSYRRGDPLGRDFFFADGQDGSPDADFIIMLKNLSPANYILTTLHNNANEDPTLLSTVEVSGAIMSFVPDVNVLQTNTLSDTDLGFSQVQFEATGGGAITVRYVCDETNDEQAYFNGFILNLFPPDTRYAYFPNPHHTQQDVRPTTTLTWKSGDFVHTHHIFLGTNFDDVNDADTSSQVFVASQPNDANFYQPSPALELNTTYHWRVDEVNVGGTGTYKGFIWNFTTAQYLLIDDMESYGELTNPIYDTWLDGIYNWSGSLVYLGETPFDPVHEGKQSMQLSYDNTINPFGVGYYSAVERTDLDPCDWTILDMKTLTLYFYGLPDNDANSTEQLYVALQDGTVAGNYAEVRYGDRGEDMNDLKLSEWTEWNILLEDFNQAGVDLSDVNWIFIGLGDKNNTTQAGGDGIIYVDDLRLNPRRCIPQYGPAGDLSGNCIVDWADVRIMAEDWLERGYGTITPTPPDANRLALQYLFDESSGTTVADNTGHGYAGTFFIDVNQIPAQISGRMDPGKSGNSFHFSSPPAPLGYGGISIPNDVFVDYGISQQITVSMWIKNAHPEEEPDGGAYMWEFRQWDGNSTEGGNRVLAVEVSDRGDDYGFRDDDDSVWFDHEWNDHTEWQHYAFVRDADTLKIYVDGFLESKDNSSGNPMAVPGLLYLGISADLAPGNTGEMHDGFTGNTDDFRIYSYALSYGQVLSLAEQGSFYHAVDSEANLFEPGEEEIINIKDFAVIAISWLEQKLWPE